MQGVAVAPGNTNFNREDWVQVTDSSILYPVYPWEGKMYRRGFDRKER